MAWDKIKSENYSALGGVNSKVSSYQQGPEEFRDIKNLNFSTPGSLTKRPGTALYTGATISGRITGGTEFERLNGASYIISSANTNLYSVTTGSFSAVKTGLTNGSIFDFVTFVDRLFCANGAEFFKFDGTNTYNFSLPVGNTSFGITAIVGGGLSGVYSAAFAYVNERGYIGPCSIGRTLSLNGATFGSIGYVGIDIPSGYGVTAIQLYRSSNTSSDEFGTTLAPAAATATDTGFPLTASLCNDNLHFTLAPKFLEIYNNQLFMAGFSSIPSTVYWSNIAEPEGIDPTFFAEFRTNDGDIIRAMKVYAGSLAVLKEKSVHRITGDNPSNFALQEISDQYGCLSNRAIVQFEDYLWFLDSKGIVEYNGANITVVSNKVEEVFQRMNISAARDNAVAIHSRATNEVWFAIPVDGSTINNVIVVYDYLVKAWTKYEGVNASHLFIAKGALATRSPLVGGYTGSISYFGSTLFGDLGAGITCSFRTRFLAQHGESAESQYRRFYLNVDPISGVTLPINVNLMSNYGSTVQVSRTMYQAPFQSRIDYGISAKSLQAEVIHASASYSIKIHGFTVESRIQRLT